MAGLARTHGAMDTTAMNRSRLALAAVGITMLAGLSLACSDPPTSTGATTYPVGGMVTGLEGSGLVLRNNGGDDLSVTANGPVVFATPLASGASYSVTVLTQPTSPGQTCVVASGRGTVTDADVMSVGIFCAATTYTVGGTVSGLVGTGLVLRNNGGDDLAVSSNGAVTFATSLFSGAAYGVTVFTQPTSPAQSCEVTGGNGTVATANVTNIAITCATNPNTYTVGGTVSGLLGSGLVLQYNGGDDLAVSANGTFTFATPLASGATYSITVFTHPDSPAQTCVVTGGNGTVSNANVTAVAIVCVTNAGLGDVRMTASTTGPDAPAAYRVGVDYGSTGYNPPDVPSNGTVSFSLDPGDHTVSLTVPENCTVTSPNPVIVTVTSSTTTDIAFGVTCVAAGTVQVTVVTTGPDAPATYTFYENQGASWDYAADVPSNGAVSFALALGTHSVGLLANRNCTVTSPNPVSVTVAAGRLTTINFSVTCVALGTIQVTMATTGTGAPATYMVRAMEVWHYYPHTAFVPSNGTVSFKMPAGTYTVKLTLPLNCTLPAHTSNPVTVTLASGATTTIARSVTCGAPATLRVTAATTGLNAPASYSVGVDPASYGSYKYYASISSYGTVSTILPPGSHIVNLLVPLNCTVTSPNNVSVTLTSGATTDLGFTVACQ